MSTGESSDRWTEIRDTGTSSQARTARARVLPPPVEAHTLVGLLFQIDSVNQPPDPQTSLLIELRGDRPGALEEALKPFARHGVSLTHIESRPRRAETFDFYVDCVGESGDPAMRAIIAELRDIAVAVVVLGHRDVAWFPRHAAELDRIANNTLEAGDALQAIGHAPMFADAAFAELSQEIGLASLGATDEDIERLSRCYWHSVEFGLLREGGEMKAYGAGLLSSFGELEHACAGTSDAAFVEWDPPVAALRAYPVTEYQPVYFVAESLQDAKIRMRGFCEALPRPFYARFHPATDSVWVDRAVRRHAG